MSNVGQSWPQALFECWVFIWIFVFSHKRNRALSVILNWSDPTDRSGINKISIFWHWSLNSVCLVLDMPGTLSLQPHKYLIFAFVNMCFQSNITIRSIKEPVIKQTNILLNTGKHCLTISIFCEAKEPSIYWRHRYPSGSKWYKVVKIFGTKNHCCFVSVAWLILFMQQKIKINAISNYLNDWLNERQNTESNTDDVCLFKRSPVLCTPENVDVHYSSTLEDLWVHLCTECGDLCE
jgi:hypothetical protein